ncbi:hypothetical protein M5Y49_20625 [Escherichia coli]|nr:hypothetical protein [Escherichia coli]
MIYRQKTEILFLSAKTGQAAGLTGLFPFNSFKQADIPLRRSGKTRLISSTHRYFNNVLTYKTHILYDFYWSTGCFFNISLNVIVKRLARSTVSEK